MLESSFCRIVELAESTYNRVKAVGGRTIDRFRKGKGFLPGLLLGGIIIIGILTAIAVVKGEEEARKAELHNVQSAVVHMMADNDISVIPNPVTVATNDMGAFPDATTSAVDKGSYPGDKDGYLLYEHDKTADGATSPTINYVSFATTIWSYTVTSDGTVIQDD